MIHIGAARNVDAVAILGGQQRFQLADARGVQHLDLDPVIAAGLDLGAIGGKGLFRPHDVELAPVPDHPVGRGARQQIVESAPRARQQPGQGRLVPSGGFGRGVAQELEPPGHQRGQMAPAHHQRPLGVGQHARDAPQQPRCGQRQGRPDLDHRRVARRATGTRFSRIDQGDCQPPALQRQRRAQPDDPRTEDEDCGTGLDPCHHLFPFKGKMPRIDQRYGARCHSAARDEQLNSRSSCTTG